MKIDAFTTGSQPITFIVNAVHPVAIRLAKLLLDQGSKVVIVDKYQPAKKEIITELSEHKNCLFIDKDSVSTATENFKKIDYVYYFIDQLVRGSNYPEKITPELSSRALNHKDFIKETEQLDMLLSLTQEHKAKFVLITAGTLSQFFNNPHEQNLQLHKYSESLANDYFSRNRINGRIIRLAELLGDGGDVSCPTHIARLLREAILTKKVNIFGEGLQNNYYAHVDDAVYSVLKIVLSDETKGKTMFAGHSLPASTMGLIYQVMELTTDDKEIAFNPITEEIEQTMKLKDLSVAETLADFTWEEHTDISQILMETIDYLSKELGKEWKTPKIYSDSKPGEVTEKEKQKKIKKKVLNLGNPLNFAGGVVDTISKKWNGLELWMSSAKSRTVVEGFKTAISKALRWSLISVAVIFAWMVLLPYIHLGVTAVKLVFALNMIRSDIENLQTTRLESYGSEIRGYTDSMQKDIQAVQYVTKLGEPVKSIYENNYLFIRSLVYYGESIEGFTAGIVPYINYVKALNTGSSLSDIEKSVSNMANKKEEITNARQWNQLGKSLRERKEGLNALLSSQVVPLLNEYDELLISTEGMEEYIPYLLGTDGQINYAVVLVNNTEVKPLGGSIMGYSIISVNKGVFNVIKNESANKFEKRVGALKADQDISLTLGSTDYPFSMISWESETSKAGNKVREFLAKSGYTDSIDNVLFLDVTSLPSLVSEQITIDGLGQISTSDALTRIVGNHGQSNALLSTPADWIDTAFGETIVSLIKQSVQKENISNLLSVIGDKGIRIHSKNAQIARVAEQNGIAKELPIKFQSISISGWTSGQIKSAKPSQEVVIEIVEGSNIVHVQTLYDFSNELLSQGDKPLVYEKISTSTLLPLSNNSAEVTYQGVLPSGNLYYVKRSASIGPSRLVRTSNTFTYTDKLNTFKIVLQPGFVYQTVRVSIVPKLTESAYSQSFFSNNGYVKVGEAYIKTLGKGENTIIMP